MSIEKTGALVSRGVGVGLIIMGVSTALYWPIFQTPGLGTSGWTSYSPPATAPDPVTLAHDAYYSVTTISTLYLPSLAQGVAGAVMLLLSGPIGCWLARGLSDRATDDEA
jgi:hypothetical protein